MKVRFYCDIPSQGVRVTDQNVFCAFTAPPPAVIQGYTRVAFDVDMPFHLVLPAHDMQAPATIAQVVEEGGN